MSDLAARFRGGVGGAGLPGASLLWKLVVPTALAILVMTVAVAALTPRAVVDFALADAVVRSIQTGEQIRTLRSFYSEHVAAPALRGGVRVSPAYKTEPSALPVPTSFVLDVAQAFSNDEMQVRLVSPYPWPMRAGRVLDGFQQDAWGQLTHDPGRPVVRREQLQGRDVLRVAIADRMDASCVACHNSNPQSPKRDWAVGDVRGLVEVVTPMALVTAGAWHLSWRIVAGLGVAGVLLLGVLFAIGVRLIRPLRDLTDVIHRVAGGRHSGAVPHLDRRDEVGTVARAVESFQEQTRERVRAEAQITHMAQHDALTGLPNRVLLQGALAHASARSHRGEQFAVLSLDLDRFKPINDAFGQHVGDELLRAVADRLAAVVREGDLIARPGADEFVVVQGGVEHPGDATALADRMLAAIGKAFCVGEHRIAIGASLGIAFGPGDGASGDEVLAAAHMAHDRAKAAGGASYALFEPQMDAKMRARRSLEIDLSHALLNDELRVYYQPIVDLARDRVSGFEALLRWEHPARGLVPPNDFIGIAEETGAIAAIGAWVLQTACRDAASWPNGLNVAVNLSPMQFKGHRLVDDVRDALLASGLAPGRLELEITETVMLQDTAPTLEILAELRALGPRISMDDFGTGYSSLSYLRRFPFDKIKIDQCFVREMSEEPESMAILRAITGLGASLGVPTLAEGVETAEQLRRLRLEGCAEVQGYLFSKPRPGAEVPEMMRRSACQLQLAEPRAPALA